MADDDANNGQEQVCKIYDQDDWFTVFVQLLLAFLALLSLWFKRNGEKPRRTFRTWFLDISKQGFGACYAHVLNMIIAAVLSANLSGETQLVDQCAWYGMSYLIDTTLGLVLSIVCLKLLDHVAHEQDWVSLKYSGVYVGPDGMLHWAMQVLAWMMILTVVKIIVYYFMLATSGFLSVLGGFIFAPLQFNIRVELLFVMIFFPGFLNLIYFWIADGYLKAQGEHEGAHEPEENADAEDGAVVEVIDRNKVSETPYEAMPLRQVA